MPKKKAETYVCRYPCKGHLSPRTKTRNGSTSTITLATMKVGRCTYFLKGSPKPNAGPKWYGVKGMFAQHNIHVRFFIGF
ncbi:MAG: hypothetical protein NWE76_05390 [Candidatus Bathyarchaeota archaeon]|nr:hypothetical protein [Candidatus Bathyarchaeota archaeon]